MAREEVKELPSITQAFVEGKTIQDWIKDTWKDKEYTLFGRIKSISSKTRLRYRHSKT